MGRNLRHIGRFIPLARGHPFPFRLIPRSFPAAFVEIRTFAPRAGQQAGARHRTYMTKLYWSFPWLDLFFFGFLFDPPGKFFFHGWFFRKLAFYTPADKEQSQ